MTDNPERKQDLSDPGEEALEQHVREMLDVNEPDTPPTKPLSDSGKTSKKVSISVTHHDDSAEPDKSNDLKETIESINEQLADGQPATAPLVQPEKKPTKTVAKKLEIKHFSDEDLQDEPEVPSIDESVTAEPEPEKQDIEPATEPIEEPAAATEPIEEAMSQPAASKNDESPLSSTIESPETDKAVSDIVATESDLLLDAEDARTAPVSAVRQKRKKRRPLRALFATPARRWAIFLLLFGGLVAAGATPTSRYYVLNQAGVRSSLSVVVLDQSSEQPLKNVKVTIDGKVAQTDAEGRASLSELRLGPTEISIEKRAFASHKQRVTVGWGSNPIGNVSLKPTGSQLLFRALDYVSGQPLTNVEAVLGEATAVADEKGEIRLTVDDIEGLTAKVTFTSSGYRDQVVDANLNEDKIVDVTLVQSQKVAFISKRAGTYDLYKVDIDGGNEQLVLAGTGKERDDIVLAAHPIDQVAAIASTRDGKYGTNGQLLTSLNFVNLADNNLKQVASSSQLKLVDWMGSRIIYTQLMDDLPLDDPGRTRLMSYDYRSGDNRQLAATNYFNDVVPIDGKVYYAPASAHQQGVNNGMFVVNPDGSGKQAVFNQEVWNMFRTGHSELVLAVQQDWYKYNPGDKEPQKLDGQPTSTASRQYADSPDGTYSLRVDIRDGKPTLLLYKRADKSETALHELIGLKQPIHWLGPTTFVVRVVSDSETADYAMSVLGGTPRKITNVTDARGIERWTY